MDSEKAGKRLISIATLEQVDLINEVMEEIDVTIEEYSELVGPYVKKHKTALTKAAKASNEKPSRKK